MRTGNLIRFILVGGGTAVFYFALTWVLHAHYDIAPFFAAGFAYLISFLGAYLLQHRWTFRSSAVHSVTLPRYAAAQAVTVLLTSSCTQAASHFYPELSAPALAAGSTLLAGGSSFLLSSLWVFSGRPSASD